MSIRQVAKNKLRGMVSKTRWVFMLYHLTILSFIIFLSGGCGNKKSMGDLIGYLKAEGWEGTYNAKLAQIIGAEEGGSYEGTSFAVEIYCFSSADKAESAKKAGLSNETCYQNGTFILVADETEKKLIHTYLNFNKTIKQVSENNQKVSENNQKECQNNLMQIQGAVEQCRLAGIEAPKASDIFGPNSYIKKELVCPTVNRPYVITNTDNPAWKPTCPCKGGGKEDTAALSSENNLKECRGNLMQIQGAVEQCWLAGIKAPKASDIFGPNSYIKKELVCPTVKRPYVMTNTDNTDWVPICPGGIEGHVVR